jgi:hypothetical protein
MRGNLLPAVLMTNRPTLSMRPGTSYRRTLSRLTLRRDPPAATLARLDRESGTLLDRYRQFVANS